MHGFPRTNSILRLWLLLVISSAKYRTWRSLAPSRNKKVSAPWRAAEWWVCSSDIPCLWNTPDALSSHGQQLVVCSFATRTTASGNNGSAWCASIESTWWMCCVLFKLCAVISHVMRVWFSRHFVSNHSTSLELTFLWFVWVTSPRVCLWLHRITRHDAI